MNLWVGNLILKHFIKNTSGNFGVILSLSMLPVMMGIGVAVDYSQLANRQTSLQNSVDGAILSVGQTFEDMTSVEIEQKLQDFLKATLAEDEYKSISKLDVLLDKPNHKLTVTAKSSTDTNFMLLAGVKTMGFNAVSQIRSSFGKMEIAFVLDNTGSMNQEGKLDALKTAATDFANGVMTKPTGGIAKIGIVPFGNYVNVGLDKVGASWLTIIGDPHAWNGCVGSRLHPFNLDDSDFASKKVPGISGVTCGAQITPLTDNRAKVLQEINDMVATGMTYVPSGLTWGRRILSHEEPFSEAASDAAVTADNINRFMVLMTDGENTVSAQLPGSPFQDGHDVV